MQYSARQWPDVIQIIEVGACPETIRSDGCKVSVVGLEPDPVDRSASKLDMGLIAGVGIDVECPTYITLCLDQETRVGTVKEHC
jgi:hypothetical protein